MLIETFYFYQAAARGHATGISDGPLFLSPHGLRNMQR
jgi:hypothetical protein